MCEGPACKTSLGTIWESKRGRENSICETFFVAPSESLQVFPKHHPRLALESQAPLLTILKLS